MNMSKWKEMNQSLLGGGVGFATAAFIGLDGIRENIFFPSLVIGICLMAAAGLLYFIRVYLKGGGEEILKRYKKLVFIVCTIGILFFTASQIGYRGYGSLYPISLKTTQTESKEIVKELFEKELKTCASWKMLYSYRLADYSIDDIRARKQANGNIKFTIDYSVKPKWCARGYWIAGNGVQEWPWIKDKRCMGEIQYKDGVYILTGHGTGP